MTQFLRRILFGYFPPYWKQCGLLFICILTLIAFDTLFPLGVKFLIDYAIVPHNGQMLVLLVVGLVGLYLISSVGSLGGDYLTAWVEARVLNDMRLKMFSHLHNLPANYYARLQQGDVITRFNTDLITIEYALEYSVILGIQSILQLVLSIIVLFMLDVKLGALTILILPLTALFPKLLVDRASNLVSERRIQESDLTSTVHENLQAHAVIRAFGLHDLLTASFIRQLNHYADFLPDQPLPDGQ